MSTAADDQPLPRRGRFQKKAPAPLPRRDGLKKKVPRRALKNNCRCRDAAATLPRWYSKKCFDFRACDWFELELLLLIDLIC
jgi:hypothetical protein